MGSYAVCEHGTPKIPCCYSCRKEQRTLKAKRFMKARKKALLEWKANHPEGIVQANFLDAKKFLRKRTKEILAND